MKRMFLPTHLVVSLLSGATQVSVPVKPQLRPENEYPYYADDLLETCPFPVGTEVWVPEVWQYYDWTEEGIPYIRYQTDGASLIREDVPDDWMDRVEDVWATLSDPDNYNIDGRASDRRWRPAITMPSWAARLRYIVEGVKVGRVWDVTEEEAMAHGMAKLSASNYLYSWDATRDRGYDTAHTAYSVVWNAAYPDYPWDSNPWRYTYTVRRL